MCDEVKAGHMFYRGIGISGSFGIDIDNGIGDYDDISSANISATTTVTTTSVPGEQAHVMVVDEHEPSSTSGTKLIHLGLFMPRFCNILVAISDDLWWEL
jgi:hypothetical protein